MGVDDPTRVGVDSEPFAGEATVSVAAWQVPIAASKVRKNNCLFMYPLSDHGRPRSAMAVIGSFGFVLKACIDTGTESKTCR